MNVEITDESYVRMKALGMHENEIAFILQTSVRQIDKLKKSFDAFDIDCRVEDLQDENKMVQKRLNRYKDNRGRKVGWRKSEKEVVKA